MYLSRKRYQQLAQVLRHIPAYLSHLQASCALCGYSFKPDWLKKRAPFSAAILTCPSCRAEVNFDLPIEEQKARYGFFGDEAYRVIGDKYVLTYSIVGTNYVRVPEIETLVKEFKKSVAPTVDPNDWVLHMKDIWPTHAQRRHPVFSNWSRESMVSLCGDLFSLFKSFDDAFLIYNISAVFYKPKDKRTLDLLKKEVRQEAYTLLVMEVIDNATRYGVVPIFVFDADKKSNADVIIHQWAQDAFHGSQLNLVYSYVARGIEIPEPIFVTPASRPCLELADFVSYIVARYIYRRLNQRTIDLDPCNLGKVTYLGFDVTGNVRRAYSAGYPWEQFFENG